MNQKTFGLYMEGCDDGAAAQGACSQGRPCPKDQMTSKVFTGHVTWLRRSSNNQRCASQG